MSIDDHDLDLLTGIRSGKPSFYVEYLASAERLRRVIHALDRISRALVRTTEGPGTLVRAVAEAAAEHLTAHWVVFALADELGVPGRLSEIGVEESDVPLLSVMTMADACLSTNPREATKDDIEALFRAAL